MKSKWCGFVVSSSLLLGCASTSGVIGPQGYQQSVVKYQVDYLDADKQSFLPDDWALDNYTRDTDGEWSEKTGKEYQATRELDEDGDGDISPSEKNKESIFDLRFVNQRDGAVIWLKVHPLAFADSKRELEVILDNYADGLAGAGLFEQSSLFGLRTDKERHYTTFVEKKVSTNIGPVGAILGLIEIAEVEKLRLDATHRDSKAELLFAKVRYREPLNWTQTARWPVETVKEKRFQVRTGLLVIGYYDSASRFDSHLADFNGLLARIQIPAKAIPPGNARPEIHSPPAASTATSSTATAPAVAPSAPVAPSATPAQTGEHVNPPAPSTTPPPPASPPSTTPVPTKATPATKPVAASTAPSVPTTTKPVTASATPSVPKKTTPTAKPVAASAVSK